MPFENGNSNDTNSVQRMLESWFSAILVSVKSPTAGKPIRRRIQPTSVWGSARFAAWPLVDRPLYSPMTMVIIPRTSDPFGPTGCRCVPGSGAWRTATCRPIWRRSARTTRAAGPRAWSTRWWPSSGVSTFVCNWRDSARNSRSSTDLLPGTRSAWHKPHGSATRISFWCPACVNENTFFRCIIYSII